MRDVSLFQLYRLRAIYLFIVAGLGAFVWPDIVRPDTHWGPSQGMADCMVAAFSILCLIGIRYPLMILPVLIWEVIWKTLWLLIVPFPQWLEGHVDDQIHSAVFSVSMVGLVYIAIPWRYAFARFVAATGDRWT